MISVFERKGNLEALLRYNLSLEILYGSTSIPSLSIRACSEVDEEDVNSSLASSAISVGISEARSLFLSKCGLEKRMARKSSKCSFFTPVVDEVEEDTTVFSSKKSTSRGMLFSSFRTSFLFCEMNFLISALIIVYRFDVSCFDLKSTLRGSSE